MGSVQSLWPNPSAGTPTSLTDADLERVYDYPENPGGPWLQVNFVSSADGAAHVHGSSDALSHPADKRIFLLGRDLADLILVGAGTVRAENYRGARTNDERRARRARLGRSEVPPIAVVSGNAAIEPDSALLTDTRVPPIIITTTAAPEARRAALAEAGAEILVAGDTRVDLTAALRELAGRGLRRINCEGGPHLFGQLVAEDLVDQLCLTVAPLLAGGGADRIAAGGATAAPRAMELASVLHEDGFTMLRYRRRERSPG
ncbi:pyrimidine reductase family protein [Amycolatopsis nigrescens]|uniref:pyrimidine reductase family protein n=1 Tax=Amycolatopsis nigrescens TaxID=381445 RepID=UPI0003659833|nr:pyrimidine reductase family protein [Amycolatopsis nigrescens]